MGHSLSAALEPTTNPPSRRNPSEIERWDCERFHFTALSSFSSFAQTIPLYSLENALRSYHGV